MFTLVQSIAVNLDIAKVIRSLIKFIERRPFDMLISGPIKFRLLWRSHVISNTNIIPNVLL